MITLTMQDEKRLDVIQRVYRDELTVVQAALVMGVSERQCYRVKARVGKVGAKGVVHGNRGRRCKRKTKEKTVRRVVELARGKYQGFNDHHLTEKLKEQEQIELSREKVRRILRAEGIASPRKRRGIKHRSRRERRASEGMMLQVDGSPHDWLQGRGPRLCLDVHVLLDGAVEFFYKSEKIATFDSKTTHTIGLYRTNAKKEGFRYGPLSMLATHHEVSP